MYNFIWLGKLNFYLDIFMRRK